MEVNFYIWLVLTIVVTVYVGILIVRWQKKQDAKNNSPKTKSPLALIRSRWSNFEQCFKKEK